MTLSLARSWRDGARKLLANEVDPGVVKQQSKRISEENAANSFETVARKWFAKFYSRWAPSYATALYWRDSPELLHAWLHCAALHAKSCSATCPAYEQWT